MSDPLYCSVCDVHSSSSIAHDDHLRGAPHNKVLKRRQLDAQLGVYRQTVENRQPSVGTPAVIPSDFLQQKVYKYSGDYTQKGRYKFNLYSTLLTLCTILGTVKAETGATLESIGLLWLYFALGVAVLMIALTIMTTCRTLSDALRDLINEVNMSVATSRVRILNIVEDIQKNAVPRYLRTLEWRLTMEWVRASWEIGSGAFSIYKKYFTNSKMELQSFSKSSTRKAKSSANKLANALLGCASVVLLVLTPLKGWKEAYKWFEPIMKVLTMVPFSTYFVRWFYHFVTGDDALSTMDESMQEAIKRDDAMFDNAYDYAISKGEDVPFLRDNLIPHLPVRSNVPVLRHNVATCKAACESKENDGECNDEFCCCVCHTECVGKAVEKYQEVARKCPTAGVGTKACNDKEAALKEMHSHLYTDADNGTLETLLEQSSTIFVDGEENEPVSILETQGYRDFEGEEIMNPVRYGHHIFRPDKIARMYHSLETALGRSKTIDRVCDTPIMTTQGLVGDDAYLQWNAFAQNREGLYNTPGWVADKDYDKLKAMMKQHSEAHKLRAKRVLLSLQSGVMEPTGRIELPAMKRLAKKFKPIMFIPAGITERQIKEITVNDVPIERIKDGESPDYPLLSSEEVTSIIMTEDTVEIKTLDYVEIDGFEDGIIFKGLRPKDAFLLANELAMHFKTTVEQRISSSAGRVVLTKYLSVTIDYFNEEFDSEETIRLPFAWSFEERAQVISNLQKLGTKRLKLIALVCRARNYYIDADCDLIISYIKERLSVEDAQLPHHPTLTQLVTDIEETINKNRPRTVGERVRGVVTSLIDNVVEHPVLTTIGLACAVGVGCYAINKLATKPKGKMVKESKNKRSNFKNDRKGKRKAPKFTKNGDSVMYGIVDGVRYDQLESGMWVSSKDGKMYRDYFDVRSGIDYHSRKLLDEERDDDDDDDDTGRWGDRDPYEEMDFDDLSYFEDLNDRSRLGNQSLTNEDVIKGRKTTYDVSASDEKLLQRVVEHYERKLNPESLLGKQQVVFDKFFSVVYQFYIDDMLVSSATQIGNKVIVPLHAISQTGKLLGDIKEFKVVNGNGTIVIKNAPVKLAEDLVMFTLVAKAGVKTKSRVPGNEPCVILLWDNNGSKWTTKLGFGYCTKNGYHSCPTKKGDCAAPIISAIDGAILGFHTAGGEHTNKFLIYTDEMSEKIKTESAIKLALQAVQPPPLPRDCMYIVDRYPESLVPDLQYYCDQSKHPMFEKYINNKDFVGLGCIPKYAPVKNRKTRDMFMSGFLVDNPIDFTGYSLVNMSEESVWKDVAKYAKPLVDLPEECIPAFNFAFGCVLQEFSPYLEGSVVSSLEDVINEADYSTSPGFPYNKEYATKTEFRESDRWSEFKTFMEEDFNDMNTNTYMYLFNIAGKEEIRPIEKVHAGNIRSFCAAPFDAVLNGRRLWADMDRKFTACYRHTSSAVGFSPWYHGWDDMCRQLFTHPTGNGMDGVKWDRTMSALLQSIPMHLRYQWLCDSDRVKYKEHIKAYYMNNVYSLVVLPNGDVVRINGGMKSGTDVTLMDNTLITIFTQYYTYARCMQYAGKRYSYGHYHENIAAKAMGDDNVSTKSNAITPYMTNENVIRAAAELGIEYEADFEQPVPAVNLVFLSTKTEVKNGMYYPVSNPDKLLTSLLYVERGDDPVNVLERAYGIMQLLYPHPKHYDWVKNFIRYVVHKFDDELRDSQEWQVVKKSIPSDVMVDNLYTGTLRRSESSKSGGKVEKDFSSELSQRTILQLQSHDYTQTDTMSLAQPISATASFEQKEISRGKRVLNDTALMDKDARGFLIAALDPFHDSQFEPRGYPDNTTVPSVICTFNTSIQINAPSNVTAGQTYDCHVFNYPYLTEVSANISGGAKNKVYPLGFNYATGGSVGYGSSPLSGDYSGVGVQALTGPSGSNLLPDPDGSSIADVTCNRALYPSQNMVNAKARLIGLGIEGINTTSELNKQGLCTLYRMGQPEDQYVQQTYSSGTGTSTYKARLFNMPPTNVAEALVTPGSQQFMAKEGAYVVATPINKENPFRMTENLGSLYMMGNYFANESTITYGIGNSLAPDSSGNPNFPVRVYTPFNTSGMYFTGLSYETTLTINVRYYFEIQPSPHDSLITLARPSSSPNDLALDMLTRLSTELPVGCMATMNPNGEWFADVLGAIGSIAPALSFVHPALGLLGTGAGIGEKFIRSMSDSAKKEVKKELSKPKHHPQVVLTTPKPMVRPVTVKVPKRTTLPSVKRKLDHPAAGKKALAAPKKK